MTPPGTCIVDHVRVFPAIWHPTNFNSIDWFSVFGQPPRIGGIKVYDKLSRNEIMMDIDLMWVEKSPWPDLACSSLFRKSHKFQLWSLQIRWRLWRIVLVEGIFRRYQRFSGSLYVIVLVLIFLKTSSLYIIRIPIASSAVKIFSDCIAKFSPTEKEVTFVVVA